MPPRQSMDQGGHTDIAAIAAAVVAVAVAMFVVTGPYDAIGAMVAITLWLIIGGYVWKHHRTIFQSVAIAALLGVIATPIIGFVLELTLAHDKWSLLTRSEPLNGKVGVDWRECEPRRSDVNNIWPIGIWLVVGGLVFVADRRQQRGAS